MYRYFQTNSGQMTTVFDFAAARDDNGIVVEAYSFRRHQSLNSNWASLSVMNFLCGGSQLKWQADAPTSAICCHLDSRYRRCHGIHSIRLKINIPMIWVLLLSIVRGSIHAGLLSQRLSSSVSVSFR